MPKKLVGTNASVFVKNLPYDAREVDLKEVFAKYGRLRDVYIPLDFHTKEPRGFGYVQFENVQDADAAVEELKGFKMKGRELDVRFAEGDRKLPGQMVRKENSMRRNNTSARRSISPSRRRKSPHRSTNRSCRSKSPLPFRTSSRTGGGSSPLLRQYHSPLRQRSPILRNQLSSCSRQRSPLRNRMSSSSQRRSPIATKSAAGKEHMVRRNRSSPNRRYHRSPQRRGRSPVHLTGSGAGHNSDHNLRGSPSHSNRGKQNLREELVISSRRSVSPQRSRHCSNLTNHRITVANDSCMRNERTIESSRQGKQRLRDDQMIDRRNVGNVDDGRNFEESTNNRERKNPRAYKDSPPRKRPIGRFPVSENPPNRSRLSSPLSRKRGPQRRGREMCRSPRARVLLKTPMLAEKGLSTRSQRKSEMRLDDYYNHSRRKHIESRRNNDDDYEFVDEEEYYEELDAMDDMDNLDIDFNQ